MKTILDEARLHRRSLLANVASVGGLLVLLSSVLLPLFFPRLSSLATFLMIAGLLCSMLGIFYANRWVRKPRPEDSLGKALKGLSDGYRLYHYPRLLADHVLLGPNGLTVIETVNLEGQFSYKNGRWSERMGFGRALRYIVEEHLGNPGHSASDAASSLHHLLSPLINSETQLMIQPMVIFTHPRAHVELEDVSPVPVVKLDKLRSKVTTGKQRLMDEDYQAIKTFLDQKTVG